MFKSHLEARPCRNFCILGSDYIPTDPMTGKELYAIVSYAGGGLGTLILIDPENKTGESFPLPSDEGAWAVRYLPEKGLLLIGTCAHKGMLHRFDMKTRRFLPSLSLEGERYFWNFAVAENGRVYGGSWPNGVLAEYDPETETLRNLGHVGDPENGYTKSVRAVPGGVLVNSGFAVDSVWFYDIENGSFRQIGENGETSVFASKQVILTKTDSEYRLYSASDHAPLDHFPLDAPAETVPASVREYIQGLSTPLPFGIVLGESGSHIAQLKNGEYIGVKGQDLVWSANGVWSYKRIPVEAVPCNIMTVSAAPDGILWGSAEFGQTLFRFDPSDGSFENTSSVAAAGGEVYGIVPIGEKLFLTSYVHGDHILYDPAAPWDQYGDQNPKLLGFSSPEMVRPQGKSVLGPDGCVWTGWWASYGNRGGGITKIDPKTLAVSKWFGVAGDQAIEHISAGPDCLYAVTSGEASGLRSEADCFQSLILDLNGHILRSRTWPLGVLLHKVLRIGDRLVLSRSDLNAKQTFLTVLDCETLEAVSETELSAGRDDPETWVVRELLDCKNGLCCAFADGRAILFDPSANAVLDQCETPGVCQTAALAPDGTIWFAVGEKLCSIR